MRRLLPICFGLGLLGVLVLGVSVLFLNAVSAGRDPAGIIGLILITVGVPVFFGGAWFGVKWGLVSRRPDTAVPKEPPTVREAWLGAFLGLLTGAFLCFVASGGKYGPAWLVTTAFVVPSWAFLGSLWGRKWWILVIGLLGNGGPDEVGSVSREDTRREKMTKPKTADPEARAKT